MHQTEDGKAHAAPKDEGDRIVGTTEEMKKIAISRFSRGEDRIPAEMLEAYYDNIERERLVHGDIALNKKHFSEGKAEIRIRCHFADLG